MIVPDPLAIKLKEICQRGGRGGARSTSSLISDNSQNYRKCEKCTTQLLGTLR
jgi:hypothetical protein